MKTHLTAVLGFALVTLIWPPHANARFYRLDHPRIGRSLVDPDGWAWSTLIPISANHSEPLRVERREAEYQCQMRGAVLPDREHFSRLRGFLGGESRSTRLDGDESHLFDHPDQVIWMGGPEDPSSPRVPVFNGRTGALYDTRYWDDELPFRCILKIHGGGKHE